MSDHPEIEKPSSGYSTFKAMMFNPKAILLQKEERS